MILSHKIQLLPSKDQETQLSKACGCSRFAYNWGLNKWNEMYKAWKGNNTLPKPTANLVKKEFNKIKEVEFPWIYESPKDSNQQAFANLNKAFTNFFKKRSKYPKFKRRNKSSNSFYVSNDQFKVIDYKITLPRIGEISLTEKLRFEGKIMSTTVSKVADKWFVSIVVEMNDYKKEKTVKNDVIGIDLGLKSFATVSDGTSFIAPKPLKTLGKKLNRLQRRHSRKKYIKDNTGMDKPSKNREKARIKVARLHARIVNIRKDFVHKFTTQVCRENQTIVIENLKVQNMMKNHKLAKAISDVGWYETRRQLTYKSLIYGNNLIVAGTFMPSSKTCSKCGFVNKELTLGDRTFVCPDCKFSIDRDLNAAINLSTLGHSGIDACGHGASMVNNKLTVSSVDEARTKQVYTC